MFSLFIYNLHINYRFTDKASAVKAFNIMSDKLFNICILLMIRSYKNDNYKIIKMLQKVFKTNCMKEISKRYLHIKKTNVGIIGVPCEKGQKKSGVELGPQALRNAGLIAKLKNLRK